MRSHCATQGSAVQSGTTPKPHPRWNTTSTGQGPYGRHRIDDTPGRGERSTTTAGARAKHPRNTTPAGHRQGSTTGPTKGQAKTEHQESRQVQKAGLSWGSPAATGTRTSHPRPHQAARGGIQQHAHSRHTARGTTGHMLQGEPTVPSPDMTQISPQHPSMAAPSFKEDPVDACRALQTTEPPMTGEYRGRPHRPRLAGRRGPAEGPALW